MYPNEPGALCVAIHDVAPATWPECLHLLHAIKAVADIPMTWLVVPQYHHSELRSRSCEATLEGLLAKGHELVLHGYTHLDAAPLQTQLVGRFLRTVYTQREGEFAAIDAIDARRRIELGLAWFRERGWPVKGFVAPAWLLGKHAWPVVSEFPFLYTTTYSHFHLLQPRRALFSPALVYAARNRVGRAVSPRLAGLVAALSSSAPLVRLAMHPRDAHHPALVRHAQRLIEQLLLTRAAVTKAAFAGQLSDQLRAASKVPTPCQSPSASVQTRQNSGDSRSVERHPWR